MKLHEIPINAKFLALVEDAYYQSSGYEQPGELGSKYHYVKVVPLLNEDDVKNWVKTNSSATYKIVTITPVSIKTTISVDVILES